MISVDEIRVNTNFARRYKATFPILSDTGKSTARAYGVLGSYNYATRWTFYIDPEGDIAYIDKDVRPLSAANDMARILGELIAKSSTAPDAGLM
jgi:peroxiredoxin Q/BCP